MLEVCSFSPVKSSASNTKLPKKIVTKCILRPHIKTTPEIKMKKLKSSIHLVTIFLGMEFSALGVFSVVVFDVSYFPYDEQNGNRSSKF